MTILDEIFAAKKIRVQAAKRATDFEQLMESARHVRANSTPHNFRASVSDRRRVNVIAEFKRASPSKGLINGAVDPADTARGYENAGACAMSVLTEEDFFQGSLNDLKGARAAVSLPILRKDFTFDEFQIYEAAAAGADAILLIVSALPADTLQRLRLLAEDELSMDALVEVHTKGEMQVANDSGAKVIGVNNRNLKTFEVSLDVSRQLAKYATPEAILISESGIGSRADIDQLTALGYSGFLVGETLMRSGSAEDSLRTLTAGIMVPE
jgi:indole-3-glycerol phosphate synthase